MKHPLFGDPADAAAAGQGRRALGAVALPPGAGPVRHLGPVLERLAEGGRTRSGVVDDDLVALFDVEAAARWLGLAPGAEGVGAVGLALREDDPVVASGPGAAALLSRAGVDHLRRVTDVAGLHPRGERAADGMQGVGHVLTALGVAWAIGRRARSPARVPAVPWPDDAIAVTGCSGADVDRPEVTTLLHTAARTEGIGLPLPLLLVVADDGGEPFATTPVGWAAQVLSGRAGAGYVAADAGDDPVRLEVAARRAVDRVRTSRRPVVLHVRCVALGPGAPPGGNGRDPLVATMTALVRREVLTGAAVGERFSRIQDRVAQALAGDAAFVGSSAPAAGRPPVGQPVPAFRRERAFGGSLPESGRPLDLASTLGAALTDVALAVPQLLVLGPGAARTGGAHAVTSGLNRRIGPGRVIDTLPDVPLLAGLARGAALAGLLPVVELPDVDAVALLRGSACVARVPIRDGDPLGALRVGVAEAVACCGHPASAPEVLREAVAVAWAGSGPCVVLEPVPLYREVGRPGPGVRSTPEGTSWRAPYRPPGPLPAVDAPGRAAPGRAAVVVEDAAACMTIAAYGEGLQVALRSLPGLTAAAIRCQVLDLRWLLPLPVDDVLVAATATGRLLILDAGPPGGGVAEALVTALLEAGYGGRIARLEAPLSGELVHGVARDLVAEGESVADGRPVTLVVDVANVMGSRPDGWWRDRSGAAARLLAELAPLAGATLAGPDGAPVRIDRLVAVVEGAAREAPAPDAVEVVRARGDGDSAVRSVAGESAAGDAAVLVVTADRGLRASLPEGVEATGPRWLLDAAGD